MKNDLQTDGTEIEKVAHDTFLGQTIAKDSRARQEISVTIKAGQSVLGEYREIILDRHLPMSPNTKKGAGIARW